MKRIIVLVVIIILCINLVACEYSRTESDLKQQEAFGFVTIEQRGYYGDSAAYLIYDPTTKVEYIVINGSGGNFSICPYYDEHGNVAIYGED